jgi:hypothetical protein
MIDHHVPLPACNSGRRRFSARRRRRLESLSGAREGGGWGPLPWEPRFSGGGPEMAIGARDRGAALDGAPILSLLVLDFCQIHGSLIGL